ncbi:hypothetical protein A8L45_23095 [Veronia pacifica]|uniref:Uncharacterized protein n=1 Tax=Veronia pacifica TaxID=1080227 RepID=A0A1C3E529_9GAMM|nr:hypothetical protein A8L45_23095 [Veronia pacifica]
MTFSMLDTLLLLSLVFTQRASVEGRFKKDWIELISAAVLGVGLYFSIKELIGIEEFIFHF